MEAAGWAALGTTYALVAAGWFAWWLRDAKESVKMKEPDDARLSARAALAAPVWPLVFLLFLGRLLWIFFADAIDLAKGE